MSLIIAHLSDIHFYHLNKNPLQFFNKRFLANFNALLTRRSSFDSNLAYQVLPFLKKNGVTHLIISGDFTSSSSKQEYTLMKNYIKHVKNEGFEIFTLPGNHDAYTKHADKNKLFYSYLEGLVPFQGETNFNLKKDGVAAYKLIDPWHLVVLDCSCKTPWHKSTGVFSKKLEGSLLSILSSLPKKGEITLVCHYPFERFRYPKAHLERGNRLEEIVLNDKRIKLYLHGHRHLHRIECTDDLIKADSGSIALKNKSSFNLIEFSKNGCELTHYQYANKTWNKTDVEGKITTLV